MQPQRFVISGGGTGGHIFPAIAIGHALQRLSPGCELLYVGANGKMEMEKVPLEGFRIVGLDIAGFNRSQPWKNITLPFKLLKARAGALQIIREFKPQVAIGVGGYASFPLLQAAQSKGIPTVIQEQNSYAGKSNKILGAKAQLVCVAYDGMERFFPGAHIVKTGNPVRASIANAKVTIVAALAHFGLQQGKPTLLVIGGSLGAKAVNEGIGAALPQLVAAGLQVIWQTGNPYYATAQQQAAPFADTVKVVNFIREMEYAYAAADMVVSRAGALAIAELCIAGKPVVFVPYPLAAEGHQAENARALAADNAAIVVNDSDAPAQLGATVLQLLHNKALAATMAQQIKKWAIADADRQIAELVIQLANSRK